MQATLRFLAGPRSGTVLPITAGTVDLGRDPTNGVVLAGANVSRLHATLELTDGILRVINRSEVNGVYLNGRRVERHELRRWDLLIIGSHILRVESLPGDTQVEEAESPLIGCLIELQRILAQDGDLLLEQALRTLLAALPASRLVLFLVADDRAIRQGPSVVRGTDVPERMSVLVAERVLSADGPLLLEAEAEAKAGGWSQTMVQQSVQTVLAAPVRQGGRVIAVLAADNTEEPHRLGHAHLRGVELTAKALEGVFLRAELRRLERDQLAAESQLSAGRLVQRQLFTKDPSQLPGPWRWRAQYQPAMELGGDFYDCGTGISGTIWVVADVSGKGVAAALVVSMLKVLCKQLYPLGLGAREFLTALHRGLSGELPPMMFVTAQVAIAADDGSLRWSGLGHPDGLVLRRDGTIERLPSTPGMLGRLGDLPRELAEGRLGLRGGDRLCLYTDGVTEAMDGEGRLFDEERLIASLRRHANGDLDQAVAGLLGDLAAFVAPPPSDDITVVFGELPAPSATTGSVIRGMIRGDAEPPLPSRGGG